MTLWFFNVHNLNLTILFSDSPIININPITNSDNKANQCTFNGEKTQCFVPQGQTVHLVCDASSNPEPNTYTWRKNSVNVNHNQVLLIENAQYVSHSGDYECHVVTKNVNGVGGLPLTSSKTISIIVTCKYSYWLS